MAVREPDDEGRDGVEVSGSLLAHVKPEPSGTHGPSRRHPRRYPSIA